MARRRKKKSKAGKISFLLFALAAAGAAGWFFSQTPERQADLRARGLALWTAFQKLIRPPSEAEEALAGIAAKRPDVTEEEATTAGERARSALEQTKGLDQVAGLDVQRLRFVAETRLRAGEQQMGLRTWPLAHAYFEASAEISEKILKTDKAALEAFNRRRAALSLRDTLAEKKHPSLNPDRWKAAEDLLASATLAFDSGNFIDAAKAFQDAALAFSELQTVSDQLFRYDRVKSEFTLAMSKANQDLMNNYGGDLWKEIQALQAQGVALNLDSPAESVAALEKALQRLPEAIKTARKARALEAYTLGMRAAEAARSAGDADAEAEGYRRALASEHGQVEPALDGFTALMVRLGKPSGQRVTLPLENGAVLDFVYLAPGSFRMGAAKGDADARPVREVAFAKPLFLARTEVTQAQWLSLFAHDPGSEHGPELPVTNVLWSEAGEFAQRVSSLRGLTARLPTEAEWEFACRAGSTSTYSFGESEADLGQHANFCDEACPTRPLDERRKDGFATLAPVASFKPNAWGFHDLHGNVMEWCADVYHPEAYRLAAEGRVAPVEADPFRCARGGSYNFPGSLAASARRYRYPEIVTNDYIGFRLALETR